MRRRASRHRRDRRVDNGRSRRPLGVQRRDRQGTFRADAGRSPLRAVLQGHDESRRAGGARAHPARLRRRGRDHPQSRHRPSERRAVHAVDRAACEDARPRSRARQGHGGRRVRVRSRSGVAEGRDRADAGHSRDGGALRAGRRCQADDRAEAHGSGDERADRHALPRGPDASASRTTARSRSRATTPASRPSSATTGACPPYRETQAYVVLVQQFRDFYAPPPPPPPPKPSRVLIPRRTAPP